MARAYTLKRRAERQAETRQKIVDAAVELHSTLGPAQTSLSMIAERAGVQRHTLYAHFPDERSLFMACSGHVFERHPPPDSAPWGAIRDPMKRLQTGLLALYEWYDCVAAAIAAPMRDAEHHALTREVSELRFGPPMAAMHEILAAKLNAKQRTLLPLALSFATWRTLVRDTGLKPAAAAMAMVKAIEAQG